MKMKMIKELAEDFKCANTWAFNDTLKYFIEFLEEKNKIRKCGTPEGGAKTIAMADLIIVD